jgi:hypothetical protein
MYFNFSPYFMLVTSHHSHPNRLATIIDSSGDGCIWHVVRISVVAHI